MHIIVLHGRRVDTVQSTPYCTALECNAASGPEGLMSSALETRLCVACRVNPIVP